MCVFLCCVFLWFHLSAFFIIVVINTQKSLFIRSPLWLILLFLFLYLLTLFNVLWFIISSQNKQQRAKSVSLVLLYQFCNFEIRTQMYDEQVRFNFSKKGISLVLITTAWISVSRRVKDSHFIIWTQRDKFLTCVYEYL